MKSILHNQPAKLFIAEKYIMGSLNILDLQDFIFQMRKENTYIGILLRGSRSTETADKNSDYDLLVIVDRDVYAIGYEYSKTGIVAHYNILSLNHLYSQCNRAYEL